MQTVTASNIPTDERDAQFLADTRQYFGPLRRLFDESLRGHGGVALVNGAVASGKTTLLYAFARSATSIGATFLYAAASRAERHLPLGIMDQLFYSAALPAASTQRVRRLLDDGRLATMSHDPDTEDADMVTPPAVLQGLSSALLQMAENTPLLIGVDDIHVADTPSLQCLSYLVRRMTSARILLVLNESTGPHPTHPEFHTELQHQMHCIRIQLTPLTRPDVIGLLTRHLGRARAQRLAEDCHAVTGGNPLLVNALIDDCRAAGTQDATPLTIGRAFTRAVVSSLFRSEPTVLKVANGLAILDGAERTTLLSELVHLDAKTVAHAIATLNDTGLLDRCRFRTTAARTAILDAMTPSACTNMHQRAAELLYRAGAPPSTIAQHLIDADWLDPTWGIPILQQAAEQALHDGTTSLSLACLRLATQHCTDERQQAQLSAAWIRAKWRTTPSVNWAWRLTEAGRNIRQGTLQGRNAMALINILLWYGRLPEAQHAIQALQQYEPAEDHDPTDLIRAQPWLSYLYPATNQPPEAPEPAVDPTAQVLAQPPSAAALTTLLRRQTGEHAIDCARQVLQAHRLNEDSVGPLTAALETLIHADHLDEADYWCQSLAGEAEKRHAPTWQALITAVHALAHYRRGDLPQAAAHASTALSMIPTGGWGVTAGLPLAVAIYTSTAMGDSDKAATYLATALPNPTFQTPFGLYYLHARGRYHQATRHHHAALADLQTCGDLLNAWEPHQPALVPWRTDLAHTYLQLGRDQPATDLINHELAETTPDQPRRYGTALRLLAATRQPQHRPDILHQALTALKQCGDQLELALAYTDLAETYQALNKDEAAWNAHQKAYQLARNNHAEQLLARLRSAVSGTQTAVSTAVDTGTAASSTRRPTENTDLSTAERRVATLAAQGLSNRQIAKELNVTTSTVEQHLTRAYRKLHITSRRQLPHQLRTHHAGPA